MVKLTAAAIFMLTFAPILLSQMVQPGTDCKSLVMRSASAAIEEVQPQKGEKYRRPAMVAYEVQENGDVRKLRLVRHSGIKELDGKLLSMAHQWKYQTRPGCSVAQVSLAAGPIPNETTALKIAEPELIRSYGSEPHYLGATPSCGIVGRNLDCSRNSPLRAWQTPHRWTLCRWSGNSSPIEERRTNCRDNSHRIAG
jgi:hypothetical protein